MLRKRSKTIIPTFVCATANKCSITDIRPGEDVEENKRKELRSAIS